ncbi:hypothetical protein ACRAWD_22820 [Caulobacter segnis]
MQSPTPFASVERRFDAGRRLVRRRAGQLCPRGFPAMWRCAQAAGQPAIVAENEQGGGVELDWRTLRQRSASSGSWNSVAKVWGGGTAWRPIFPNIPEAVAASPGLPPAWARCGRCAPPDMGAPAVLDRLRQALPKVLIAVDEVSYGGRPRTASPPSWASVKPCPA